MLAVTDNYIIIVGDSNDDDKRIEIHSKVREEIKSFKLHGSNQCPRGIVTDGTYIFITDKKNQSITKYKFDGQHIKTTVFGENQNINNNCGIAINQTMERIYIADQQNHKIKVLNLDLTFLNTFGGEGNQEGKFKYPRDVAVTDNGTLYVTDTKNNRVQVFDSEGTFIRQFGEDKLRSPAGICIDPNNHVLVADHDNIRICVFTLEGKYIASLGEKEDEVQFTDLIGIAADSDGKIYAADYGLNCVHVIQS